MLGDLDDGDRGRGMGIVVEYAGAKGKPQWRKPAPFDWDYRRFANPGGHAPPPDEFIDFVITKDNAADHGFNRWALGVAFDFETMPVTRKLALGKLYRMRCTTPPTTSIRSICTDIRSS